MVNKRVKTVLDSKKKILIDKESGEEIYVEQITKVAIGSKQFWKIYLMDFLNVLGIFDTKQIDVFIHILENTQPTTNTFIGTYTKIQEATNTSRPTIANIMKKLQGVGFISKIQNGVWQISPNVMMKGNENKKKLLINYYKEKEKQGE